MPKMIANINKLKIAQMSLDYPVPTIAAETGLNIVTIRGILDEEEMKAFVFSLKEARKTGFVLAEQRRTEEIANER